MTSLPLDTFQTFSSTCACQSSTMSQGSVIPAAKDGRSEYIGDTDVFPLACCHSNEVWCDTIKCLSVLTTQIIVTDHDMPKRIFRNPAAHAGSTSPPQRVGLGVVHFSILAQLPDLLNPRARSIFNEYNSKTTRSKPYLETNMILYCQTFSATLKQTWFRLWDTANRRGAQRCQA